MPVQLSQVRATYTQPFVQLVFQAASVHRAHHDPTRVQWSTLLSIKTGGCPEDCGYCSQSAHHKTDLTRESLLDVDAVLTKAKQARDSGSTRFCMGAAWKNVSDRDLPQVEAMVRGVKALGLETCVTLGSLGAHQAGRLKQAGLDYYNHNLDTSREHYPNVITTRSYDERLETLANVRKAGISVCCGGILGLGETLDDRLALLAELANLPAPPESVPINTLVPIPGTPLGDRLTETVDGLDVVRTIATARILMPKAYVRLSAGRESMSDELQALCFLAGANSLFAGEALLTTPNAGPTRDQQLFDRLGMRIEGAPTEPSGPCATRERMEQLRMENA